MARRSRGAATAVAPVTRATRSRTRLQAAEALAAELNASRNSCDEQSLDITTTSEVSMIDESSNQMNSGESSCSRDSTTVALSPEVNHIPNSVVSSDSTVEDSLPATKSDEQNLEEEQQKQLKKEVQDLLDITVDEVVKAQRLPNIDPATTSVQSNVCVRGVCLTKGSLDAKISMYQDYMRKHAPEQPNISIEDNRTPIDSTAEQSLVELQQNSVEQESLSSAINPNFLTITVAPAAKICLESSDVSVVASLETDLSMGQTSMKEEELPISENLQIPVLNSTEITSSNLSSSKETSSDHDNLDASKTDSQRHAQAIHYTSVVEMEGSVDTSLHPETKTSVSSSEASTVNESQNAGKDDGLQMNDNIKFDYPEEQPIGQERISSDVPSQGSSSRKEPDQICEISSGSSSTSLHPVQVHELVDESDCGSTNAAKQAVTNSSALKVPVAPDLIPGSSLPLTGTVSSPCEIQEELCSEERVKDELPQMNEDSKAEMKTSETVATNQTTSTANIVTINFPNDLNSDNTGTQEMDMEVSDDSREASVEPIIHENQNTVAAADVYSNSSNVEALPPPPPVSNDIPPPPTEDSYADDFYFPPPPTMPPNMDLSQFYMSLHAGDFGAEYTQQLTQYISESVHKWYQIHQYYTFNRAPLPRIDRYKAFMDHYDAFQRVQYTAVMRPNAEAQKLSEERSRNRIQGVLKSLVRDKKKKESAAEKNEELMMLSDEQNEKIAEEPAKPLVEIMPKVLHGSVDVAVVSSSNEVFKKASLPSPQIVNSPKVSRFDNEEVPSIISLEAENVQSVGTSEPRKDFPTDSLDREEPSPPAPFSQNKVKTERSRSRSPKRKRSYSRSRSRSRTRSRSRSRYRSKSRSRSRSRSYGRSRSRSYSRSRTSHSRSRSRSRRRGRSRSRTRSPRRYRSRSPRGYRQKSPRRWHRGYRSFRNSRGGGYRRSSRSPWSDRRSHYKGGYGGFNDRYKRRNYSRSPVREPHAQTEATSTVEKVVENIDEQIKPVEETKKEIVIEEPPFPKFEEIETLIYMDEKVSKNGKKRRLETDLDCDCRKNNLDCSDNRCINREMMFECSSKCGPQCKNRRFALRQYANVKPFYTGPNKGWGVRALEVIPKGTFIIEYIGEVVTNEEFASRQKKYAKDPNHTHHYIFELGQKLIDATVKGNSSRFINHSCDPNAICLKWAVPKTPRDVSRIGFFAKTDIAIGDEITFDYQFCNYGRTAQSCHCGSTNCKGVIGKKPDLGDFDDEEVYDEDSEEFDDGEEPEEEKEREQLRIEKEEQLEAKAIFYLNTIHSEGYYGRKQLAKNAARFVKYLANVLTTENRIRMQSLIERADSEFYQVMKKNNLFNILLQWVSSSGWDRHDLDLKIGVLRMIEEKDKDNFIEKAVGWNQENFPILCELAKGLLPDDIACVDTLEQVVEKVCGDDPEAEGDGNLASYTGVVFNEMTEIATRLASDENIKKGVETTGLKVFKIPKKVREKSVEQKEPVAEKSDHSRDRYDQRSHFRPGFPGYNGKREFDRGMKRRYDDRFRRDDEKGVSVRDGNFRTDFKRTRRSRFDQSPVRSPLALAVGAENCGQTDSPATSMSIDSSLSPTKAAMKNVLSAAQSSTHPSSFDSYHQNMAMWQSYMSMGGYPAPYPMMAFSAQKSSMSDSEKKIGYYMSMRLEQLKHFRTSYEMEIKYLDVAIKKKEAEAALAKAHQEAAAAAAAAAALANEANRNEPDSNLPSQSAPPPPPEKRRSTYARALDADGTVYYYHKETRATCWELPEGEHCDENDAVPYTQTQQPDSSMKEDEEPKCQMDIAARAIEIFSSPPGGNEKLEEVPQTTGNVEILSDLPEDEKQKRIRVFKLTVEREVKPIIDSFLKGIPSADANRRLWLIKQVAKEMYKRESSKPDSDLKFNDIIRKKVHNYTKAFMHRKCSDGAKDLWKGFEVFS